MFKKRWFGHSKGGTKKSGHDKKETEDDIGNFGAEFEQPGSRNSTNQWQSQKIFKGPNSITFQLSGPSSFAIIGRNKKIRDTLKAMVGSRQGAEPNAYEFDLGRLEGVKNALNGLGYEVNDIPPEVIRVVEEARVKSLSFEEVNMDLMPQLLLDSMLPFQRSGVEFAIQRQGKALICDDMGLGKTIQGIAIASYYMSEWPCLVLAPSSLKRVWSAEFEKWLPGIKNHVRVVESGEDFKVSQVTIIAYDLAAKIVEKLKTSRFKVILADESHMLKSPTAQRTKALVPLLQSAKRTILLSGTPALSRPSELFPQLLALHASIWTRMKPFGLRYCAAQEGLYGWDYTGNSNLIELNAVLTSTVMIRRLKAAVLTDLPEKVRKVIQIELTPIFDEITSSPTPSSSNATDITRRLEIMAKKEEELRVRDTDDEEIATLASSSTGPKRPLSSNGDDDILALYREASQVKQEGVKKYIRQVVMEENASALSRPSTFPPLATASSSLPKPDIKKGRKFLVFAHHLPMLDAVESELQSLNVSYFRIDGGTSTTERAMHVKRFEKDESLRVALLSLTCASTGLTLISASLVLFAELFWNPGTLIQAEDRVHRLGQTAPFVELRYLFCKGTVDDLLWPMIDKKLKVVGTAINGVKDQMSLAGKRSPKSKITDINTKPVKIAKPEKKKEKQAVAIHGFLASAPVKAPKSTVIDEIVIEDSQESIELDFIPAAPSFAAPSPTKRKESSWILEESIVEESGDETPMDFGEPPATNDRKRILEEPEEIEMFLPSPKRPNLSTSTASELSDTETDTSVQTSSVIKPSLATPEAIKSTPIRQVTLSFVSNTPVRLGLRR